jgi:hypothetical protein
MRRPATVTASAVLVVFGLGSTALVLPEPAGAAGPSGAYAQVLQTYQTRGSIPACKFTSQQLANALNGVDTYGQQYYADFIAAIQTALAAQASGECSSSRLGAGALPTGPAPTRTPLPQSVTSATSAGVPAPIVLLAVVGGLLAMAAALSALVRARGLTDDRAGLRGRSAGWRHGVAEARYRAGESWGAVIDRLRR